MEIQPGTPLRVVQVSFHADRQRRDADALLLAWPMLPAIAKCVARAGVDVAVVQTAHHDETLNADGVDYHFVADERRRRPRVVDRVLSLEPDVVHVQGFHHGAALWQLSRTLRKTPVLIQDHASTPPRGWRRPVWRSILGSLAGAAFTLREQARPWIDSGVFPSALTVFEVLGGSSEFTTGSQLEAQRITGIFGDPCLLWTSRLNANKDPLMMLRAVEDAMQRLPEARLWCCFGDAPMLDAVRARVAASDTLRSRAALIGTRPRDSMELLYRAADFYIQTSHQEECGFSLIEAMSCGATPIVTDIPPSRRIVGDAGSLTPVGDATAMAAAIVDWSARDRTAQRLVARNRFESALTFDTIGRELREAYESLAAGPPAS